MFERRNQVRMHIRILLEYVLQIRSESRRWGREWLRVVIITEQKLKINSNNERTIRTNETFFLNFQLRIRDLFSSRVLCGVRVSE